jgi:hypothetical protein
MSTVIIICCLVLLVVGLCYIAALCIFDPVLGFERAVRWLFASPGSEGDG